MQLFVVGNRFYAEIPLFHVLNVRVTFGNIFASDTAAPHVTCVKEAGSMMCAIDDQCFESPAGYSVVGAGMYNLNL